MPGRQLRWTLAEEERATALFDDETAVGRHLGVGAYRDLEFLHVNARRIINTVPATSPVPFRHTINAYRGCSHACVYCFARPTHEYLGLNSGQDFERRIVVKVNAVERLVAELRRPTWHGEPIAMGTNTDPYQAAEARYHLTGRIVEVLAEHRNPFGILTKSTLVLRDLPALVRAAERAPVRVDLSIGTLRDDVWRLTEPGTPPPMGRLQAVRRLREAGIECGVLVAPVIPGLSDSEKDVRAVVEAVLDCGATSVSVVPLHLRPGVAEHYLSWLAAERPDLLGLHRQRFAGRAYQAAAQTGRLQRLVREVTVSRGVHSDRRGFLFRDAGEGGEGGQEMPHERAAPSGGQVRGGAKGGDVQQSRLWQ